MSDSIATRVDALTADGYRIVKFLNYDDGDFSKIILKVESHFDEFEFKLMENVTHLPFGGGRSFTLVGVKVKEGNDQSAWQMNNFLPGQPVKATDFDIQVADGRFANGDPYRMAYIECPDETIFEFDEAWRTSTIFNDRGKGWRVRQAK